MARRIVLALVALVLAPALAPFAHASGFTETFGSWPPPGWLNQDWSNDSAYGCTLERNEDGTWHSYSGWARAHGGNVQGAEQDSRLVSPVVDVGSSGFDITLDFDYDAESGSGDIGQIIVVQAFSSGFTSCTINNSCDSDATELTDSDSVVWCRNSNAYGFGKTIHVPSSVASGTVHIMFRYLNDKFYNYDSGYFRVDNVQVAAAPPPDTEPPVTTHALAGSECNGWFSPAATVTLAATDYPIPGASGVASTSYRVGGGAWRSYATPFDVGGDGERRVDYYSTDNAGNVEATNTFDVRVDATPPETTLDVGDPQSQSDALYVSSATPFSLSAVDGASGVASTEHRVDDGAWTAYASPFNLTGEDGPRTVKYRSEDDACNVEPEGSTNVFLDNSAPDVAIEEPVTPAGATGVLVPVLSAVTDLCRAVLSEAVCAAMAPALSPLEDAGAMEAARAAAAALDDVCRTVLSDGVCDATTGALLILLGAGGAPDGAAVVTGTVTVRANATDPIVNGGAAGVARVEFHVDGDLMATDDAAPYEWAWDTAASGTGQHELVVVARDGVENVASASVAVLVV